MWKNSNILVDLSICLICGIIRKVQIPRQPSSFMFNMFAFLLFTINITFILLQKGKKKVNEQ